jgi:hypothetical protein
MMTKAILVIEDHDESGVTWHLSFDGPNPAPEHCARCLDRESAFKLKALIEQLLTR